MLRQGHKPEKSLGQMGRGEQNRVKRERKIMYGYGCWKGQE